MYLQSRFDGDVLLCRMCNPPVNCLSLELRRQLYEALNVAGQNPSISAIVLYGDGAHFCAGGDLRELRTPAQFMAPRLSADILPCIERCRKPVIAAIHGGAIGGGLELALACHFRIAATNAQICLPELEHGLFPLSGCLRLPRLLGIAPAINMMIESRRVQAEHLRGSLVFDGLVSVTSAAGCIALAELLPHAIAFARSLDANGCAEALVRHRPFLETDPRAVFEQTIRALGSALTPAQSALVDAVRAGVEIADFDTAIARAQKIYNDLTHRRSNDPPRDLPDEADDCHSGVLLP
jgi:enoyl-CoA hydratase/carnithine racemase